MSSQPCTSPSSNALRKISNPSSKESAEYTISSHAGLPMTPEVLHKPSGELQRLADGKTANIRSPEDYMPIPAVLKNTRLVPFFHKKGGHSYGTACIASMICIEMGQSLSFKHYNPNKSKPVVLTIRPFPYPSSSSSTKNPSNASSIPPPPPPPLAWIATEQIPESDDPYRILGLTDRVSADPKSIHVAANQLVLKYHPDKLSHEDRKDATKVEEMTRRFNTIMRARDYLCNSEKRKWFDEHYKPSSSSTALITTSAASASVSIFNPYAEDNVIVLRI